MGGVWGGQGLVALPRGSGIKRRMKDEKSQESEKGQSGKEKTTG